MTAATPPRSPHQQVRVLMLDDEESLVWSVGQYLKRQRPEWTFEGFADPLAALERIKAAPPTVLVTDVRMPRMSGVELLVAARAVAPSLPVIVITACDGPEVVEAVRARMGVEHMEKPIRYDALLDAIGRLAELPAGFSGDISLPMLPDLLQVYTLSMATGALTLRQGSRSGTIWMERGEIVHATCEGLDGDEAVYELLAWSGGSFHLDDHAVAEVRTITKSWQHLLLEGSRRLDEQRRDGRSEPDPSAAPSAEPDGAPAADGVLAGLRRDLPGLFAAVRVDARAGRVLGAAARDRGGDTAAAEAALAEIGALDRHGLLPRVESVVAVLDDQLHFLQRGRGDDLLFVAAERGPDVHLVAVRNAITRRLEGSS